MVRVGILWIVRTAIEDASALDATFSGLHSDLRNLLQACLPSHTVKEWCVLYDDFVWPTVFARCWTEAVHLYDLGSVIVALTAGDVLYGWGPPEAHAPCV